MNLSKGVMKTDDPLSRANLRIFAEKREFFGDENLANGYTERSKKIMKLAVFGVQVASLLIEIRKACSV